MLLMRFCACLEWLEPKELVLYGNTIVSHWFLAEYFSPLQSDVLCHLLTIQAHRLLWGFLSQGRIKIVSHPENKYGRVFLWQLNNTCKYRVNFNTAVVQLLMHCTAKTLHGILKATSKSFFLCGLQYPP